MSSRTLKAYLLFLIVTIIWAIAGPVIKLTLNGISPLPFITYRFAISAVIAVIWLLLSKHSFSTSPRNLLAIFAYGVLSTTLSLGFLFLGLDRTTVLNMSLITLTAPILIEYAGVIFFRERITKREKIGTLIAFIGTVFTIIEPVLTHTGGFGQVSGNIFIGLHLVTDISAIILLKKLLRNNVTPIFLANTSFFIGFFAILPVALYVYPPTQMINMILNLSPAYHLGVWYMAVLSGNIAYAIRARAQKTLEISQSALFGYLTPVFTTTLAVFVLREAITPLFILGGGIIFLGVIIAEYKPHKSLK